MAYWEIKEGKVDGVWYQGDTYDVYKNKTFIRTYTYGGKLGAILYILRHFGWPHSA